MANCQRFDLACSEALGDFAIYQGNTFNDVTFYYRDIDLSTYTPAGEIRTTYLEKAGTLLATFSFSPLVFASVTVGSETFNATIIVPRLSAAQTSAIPSTLPRASDSSAFAAGITGWTYDIKLVGGTEAELVVRGFVEVFPQTTV